MKRFLVTGELKAGSVVELPSEEARHALRVMRLQPGDQLLLANGRGLEAEAKLLDAGKEGARVEVLAVREAPRGRSCRLELLQAPLKGARMDWLVEKATELGVDALYPVQSEFTVAKAEKADRWQRLAQAAVKQSGNPRLPEIHALAPLAEALGRFPAPSPGLLLLSPGAEASLAREVASAARAGATRIVLAIGPEGGFSAREEESLRGRGFRACQLSPQILRGETASLAALAIALHALDFPS